MPVDMSPEAIERRLRIVGELLRVCIELRKARPKEAAPAPQGPETPDPGAVPAKGQSPAPQG